MPSPAPPAHRDAPVEHRAGTVRLSLVILTALLAGATAASITATVASTAHYTPADIANDLVRGIDAALHPTATP